jgi:multidrug efflux pump subunit AcrB
VGTDESDQAEISLLAAGSDIAALRGVQIRPANSAETVPLDQVIDGVAVRWEDPVIWRRDRKRTITVQANPIRGITLPTYMESVAPQFAELSKDLPADSTPPSIGSRHIRLCCRNRKRPRGSPP